MVIVDSLCIVCFETLPTDERCQGCQRGTCRPCLKTFLTSRVYQGYFGENSLVCPNYDCSKSFSTEELHEILEPKTREHLENLRLLAAVNRDPRRCWCPNHECGAPVDLRRRIATKRMAKCGKCERKFCPRCGEPPHRGSCPREQTYVEWVTSTELREDEDGVQACPKCHHHIEKRGGCQHMTCTVCKAEWCWICRCSWRGHSMAMCEAVTLYRSEAFGKTPFTRAATATIAVPLLACVGVGALAVGAAVGVGGIVGAIGYFSVVRPGNKARKEVSRAWRRRRGKLGAREADTDAHADVTEDIIDIGEDVLRELFHPRLAQPLQRAPHL